ncbi:transposase [Dickeya dianthicola]|uniref:transposase n=1 Tax=Dickeya dianthicola TaxID=204039 RepID=UPI003D7DC058
MDEKKLKALAAELAKGLKTEADLNAFSRMLTKLTVETALNAELTDPLGYEKNAPKSGSNTRNGYSSRTSPLRFRPATSTAALFGLRC